MKTTNNVVTINGVDYVGKVDLVMSLIESGLLEVAPTKSAKQTEGKKASAPTIDHIDKNGLKWIVPSKDFSRADYTAMSEKMFGKEKPGKANREAVYRALGYII